MSAFSVPPSKSVLLARSATAEWMPDRISEALPTGESPSAPPNRELGVVRDKNDAERKRYYERLRAQTPQERLAEAARLTQQARHLVVDGIRQQFPSATPDEVRVRLAVRLYGVDVARRLFGEVPADAT